MRSSTPSPLAAFMLFAFSVLCQNPTTTTINLGCYTSTGITSQKSVPIVVYTSTVTDTINSTVDIATTATLAIGIPVRTTIDKLNPITSTTTLPAKTTTVLVTTILPKITVTKLTSTSTATTISTITPSIASTATWTITPTPVTVISTSLVTALGATTTSTVTPGWDVLKRHPAPTPAAPLFPRAHAIDRRGGFPQTVYCGAEVYVRTTKTITSVTHTAVSYATTTSTFTATINEVVSTQTITPAASTIISTVTVASTVVSTCFEGEKTTTTTQFVTQTKPVSTVTVTASRSTVTSTVTSTSTSPPTTITVTVTATPSPSSSSSPPSAPTTTAGSPTCTNTDPSPTCSVVTNGEFTFTQYYSGTGYTENPDNPGNPYPAVFPPYNTTFDDDDVCTLIQECATACGYDYPAGYGSFDLHYSYSEDQWYCVQYSNAVVPDPGYFNVADPDVGAVYGFTA